MTGIDDVVAAGAPGCGGGGGGSSTCFAERSGSDDPAIASGDCDSTRQMQTWNVRAIETIFITTEKTVPEEEKRKIYLT